MDANVVPCTQEKIWDTGPGVGPVAAKDAYTKPCFLTWRAYAQESGLPWFILSTRYGLISPDHAIERYNVPVSAVVSRPEFLAQLAKQGIDLGLESFDKVILLDWERFEPLVRAAVGDRQTKCVLRHVCY